MEKSHSDKDCSNKSKIGKNIAESKSLKITSSISKAGSKHLFATCCVCHKTPQHTRKYYGHLFCIKCFHKYIWSAPSGDIKSFSYEDLSKFADHLKQIL